jgi:hypothetical protein
MLLGTAEAVGHAQENDGHGPHKYYNSKNIQYFDVASPSVGASLSVRAILSGMHMRTWRPWGGLSLFLSNAIVGIINSIILEKRTTLYLVL